MGDTNSPSNRSTIVLLILIKYLVYIKEGGFLPFMDWEIFGFTYPSDSSVVLKEYIEQIANEKLLYYKGIIHYGGKAGESLWAHVVKSSHDNRKGA